MALTTGVVLGTTAKRKFDALLITILEIRNIVSKN